MTLHLFFYILRRILAMGPGHKDIPRPVLDSQSYLMHSLMQWSQVLTILKFAKWKCSKSHRMHSYYKISDDIFLINVSVTTSRASPARDNVGKYEETGTRHERSHVVVTPTYYGLVLCTRTFPREKVEPMNCAWRKWLLLPGRKCCSDSLKDGIAGRRRR